MTREATAPPAKPVTERRLGQVARANIAEARAGSLLRIIERGEQPVVWSTATCSSNYYCTEFAVDGPVPRTRQNRALPLNCMRSGVLHRTSRVHARTEWSATWRRSKGVLRIACKTDELAPLVTDSLPDPLFIPAMLIKNIAMRTTRHIEVAPVLYYVLYWLVGRENGCVLLHGPCANNVGYFLYLRTPYTVCLPKLVTANGKIEHKAHSWLDYITVTPAH